MATAAKPKRTRQRAPKAEMENIQYLVTEAQGRSGGGTFVIEIPADWKVTFSSVNPAAMGGGGYREGYCLRVYEGEKLRAVYCNVQSFRDLSIPLARKVQTETGSATWTRDDKGNLDEQKQIAVASVFEDDDVEELTF